MRSITSIDERQIPVAFYDYDVDDALLSVYEYRAYMRIVRRASGGRSACTESLENMAIACRMSRPTMVRAIKSLIDRRMIRRESKSGDTSMYILTSKDQWLPGKPENHPPSKPENQGVNHTFTKGGSDVYQGVVNQRTTKNTREEYKEENKQEKPTKLKPQSPVTPLPDDADTVGDAIEDAYPYVFNDWNRKRNMVDLVKRVKGTPDHVRKFRQWLSANHPKKSDGYFSFLELFPIMVNSLNKTSSPSPAPVTYCGNCSDGWLHQPDGKIKACPCRKAPIS